MTRGRQTPQQVVDTALAAIGTTAPTVVSGWRNRVNVLGPRFAPRRIVWRMARQMVK